MKHRLSLFAGALALVALLGGGTAYSIMKTPVVMIDATGTLSSSTFLRGDGAWAQSIPDADKGDITTSSTGGTWTIDASAVNSSKISDGTVANADLANMAASTIKGRVTASTGVPEDITLAGTTEETVPAAGDFVLGWESGGALRKFDLEDLLGGGGGSVITSNTTLNVPGTYATVAAALDYLKDKSIAYDVFVTIAIAAGDYTEEIIVNHRDASRIKIDGAAVNASTFSASTTGSGSAGAYSVTYTVPSTTGMAAGHIMEIWSSSGGTGPERHRGAHVITSVPTGTTVTVTNNSFSQPQTGASGSYRHYTTRFANAGSSGIVFNSLGGLTDISFKGDSTAGKFGIWSISPSLGMTPGAGYVGPLVAVNGFIGGMRANYGGKIFADNVTVSNAWAHGVEARDGGAHIYASNSRSTGHGAGALAGASNGFIAQNTASIFCTQCYAFGNLGNGFFGRSIGSVFVDGTTSNSAYNTGWGVQASGGGFVQFTGNTANSNTAGNVASSPTDGTIIN